MKQAFAWFLVIAGFVSAVVAFFIDAERPAANPWLLFIVGVGLTVVGIILIVLDRRAVMTAVAARITRQRLPDRGDVIDDKIGGIAVHIGARITASAAAGEVLVSSTVRDLVIG